MTTLTLLQITEATPPQTGWFEAPLKLFNGEKPEQEQVIIFQLQAYDTHE